MNEYPSSSYSPTRRHSGPISPHAPGSINQYRHQFRVLGTAMVRTNHDPGVIFSPRNIEDVDAIRSGLAHIKGERRVSDGYLYDIALTVAVAASRRGNTPPEVEEALYEIVHELDPKRVGMTERNDGLLLPFKDPDTLSNFLRLPETLRERVEGHSDPTTEDALTIQVAFGIEILILNGLPGGTLIRLRRDKNFIRSESDGIVRLFVPSERERPEIDLNLPPCTVDLLDLYWHKYRPRLHKGTDSQQWLFPGRLPGTHKDLSAFRNKLSAIVLRETNLHVTIALIRHLGAMIHLHAYPNDYLGLQGMLGLKDLIRMKRRYEHIASDVVIAACDDLILTEEAKERLARLRLTEPRSE